MSREYQISSIPATNPDLAFTNKVFVHTSTYAELTSYGKNMVHMSVQDCVFMLGQDENCPEGALCMSGPQRTFARVSMDKHSISVFSEDEAPVAGKSKSSWSVYSSILLTSYVMWCDSLDCSGALQSYPIT